MAVPPALRLLDTVPVPVPVATGVRELEADTVPDAVLDDVPVLTALPEGDTVLDAVQEELRVFAVTEGVLDDVAEKVEESVLCRRRANRPRGTESMLAAFGRGSAAVSSRGGRSSTKCGAGRKGDDAVPAAWGPWGAAAPAPPGSRGGAATASVRRRMASARMVLGG